MNNNNSLADNSRFETAPNVHTTGLETGEFETAESPSICTHDNPAVKTTPPKNNPIKITPLQTPPLQTPIRNKPDKQDKLEDKKIENSLDQPYYDDQLNTGEKNSMDDRFHLSSQTPQHPISIHDISLSSEEGKNGTDEESEVGDA